MPKREPTVKELTVVYPDYIPEGKEHLYPHIGGHFYDFIPEGKTWQTMNEPEEKPEKK